MNPLADRFIGHVNASLDHQLFDITEAQIETIVQPNGSADNIRMETVAVINGNFHTKNVSQYSKLILKLTMPVIGSLAVAFDLMG